MIIHGKCSDLILKTIQKTEGLSDVFPSLQQIRAILGTNVQTAETFELHDVVIIMYFFIQFRPLKSTIQKIWNLQYGVRGDNKMRGWSNLSDFDKIFDCLFVISYPYPYAQCTRVFMGDRIIGGCTPPFTNFFDF